MAQAVPELLVSERGTPAVRAGKDIAFGSVRLLFACSRASSDLHSTQIAGIVSRFIEHPFDLTKVRLQSQVLDSQARFSGPLDCLAQTYRNEGIRGLYRVRDLR